MRIEWKSIQARPWQPIDGDPVKDCARITQRPVENQPQWIWAPDATPENQTIELVRTFNVENQQQPVEAALSMSGDNHFVAYLDDEEILRGDQWEKPSRTIIDSLSAGTHRLRVECRNDGGPAGLAAILAWTTSAGDEVTIVTDDSWHLLDGVTEPVLQRAFEYWRNVDKNIGDRIEQAVRNGG